MPHANRHRRQRRPGWLFRRTARRRRRRRGVPGARRAPRKRFESSGLRIESPNGNLHLPRVTATDDAAKVGPVDVVFFAVKLYDTESAIPLLPPLIGADSRRDPVPERRGKRRDVVARGRPPRISPAGPRTSRRPSRNPGSSGTSRSTASFSASSTARGRRRLERLFDACRDAGVSPTLSDADRGRDLVQVRPPVRLSGMTSVTRSTGRAAARRSGSRSPCGRRRSSKQSPSARAKGIDLPRGLFDELMRCFSRVPGQAGSSMLQDLERHRRLELPWLSGAVVRMGPRSRSRRRSIGLSRRCSSHT